MQRFIEEIRKRNILRAVAAYAVLAWLIIQIVIAIFPVFGVPDWATSMTVALAIVGFPVCILISWFYEWTPEGMMANDAADAAGYVKPQGFGRLFDYVIIALMAIAIGFLVYDRTTLVPSDLLVANAQSIAVLPFVNMSDDPKQEYFSEGISEELLNVLAEVPGLHVTSRSSSFQFRGGDIHIPDVAQKLGVANVLEGSVRKSGNRIRITAQLIDAATDSHLWSQTFERELTDIFAIQDEISQSIVDALYVHLGVEAPAVPKVHEVSVEAYRLYYLGRHSFEQRTEEHLTKAIDLFDQAIAIDPSYAQAYSGKADAYMLLERSGYGHLSVTESLALAEPMIERALALNPGLAEAHVSKGLFLLSLHKPDASLQSFDRAIELNPNLDHSWQWRASTLSRMGNKRGALESYLHAHALNPLSQPILASLVRIKTLFGHFSEVEVLMKKLADLEGDGISNERVRLQIIKGEWALRYTVALERYEKDPKGTDDGYLAYAEMHLKAFDPRSERFSLQSKLLLNAFLAPERAWQDYQAMPGMMKKDPWMIEAMVRAAAHLGKYEEVIKLFESLPDYDESFSGILFYSDWDGLMFAPFMIHAMLETGDDEGAERLLRKVDTWFQLHKEQGADYFLPLSEASLHALKGEGDEAVSTLERRMRQIEETGYGHFPWHFLNLPFFDALQDREDFQAIVRSVDMHINEERAKLGWEPVE